MNYKTLILSTLLISTALVANGFKMGRNLETDFDDSAGCRSCIEGENTYACHNRNEFTWVCCTEGDDDDVEACQAGGDVICSNDNSTYPGEMNYLVCPNSIYCGRYTDRNLNEGDEAVSFEATNVPSGEFCIYRLSTSNDSPTDGSLVYQYDMQTLVNGNVTLYTQDKLGNFEYAENITQGNTSTVVIDSQIDAYYAVLLPTGQSSIDLKGSVVSLEDSKDNDDGGNGGNGDENYDPDDFSFGLTTSSTLYAILILFSVMQLL